MSTAIPITRSSRQVTRDATPGQTVFTFDAGPVWDILDIVVQRKIAPATRFTTITSGFTVAILPANAGASVTFAVAPRLLVGNPAVQIRITSRRVHERSTDVSRAGRIHTPSMETELDEQTTVLQELRRDIDQNDADLRADLEGVVLGQIPDNSLFDTKLKNMPAGTVKANLSGVDAVPANATVAALLAALAVFVGDAGAGGTKGVVPAPPANAANEKRILGADGNWKLPTWLPPFIGDSGAGGGQGMVPAPAAGDAALGRVLGAGGAWVTPSATPGANSIRASQFPPALDTVNLPAIRRLLRQIPDLYDYGALPNGSDCTPAINAAIADSTCTTLYVPPGNWRMNTQPASITRPLELTGESMSDSVLVAAHTGSGLVFTGTTAVGGALRDLSINFDIGSSTGVAHVQLVSQAGGGSPDFFVIDNLNLSGFGSSKSSYGLILDGNARTTGTIGLRNVHVNNVRTFNTTVLAMDLRQCRSVTINNFAAFVGSGSNNGIIVQGAAGAPSDTVMMSNINCGDLTVDRCSRFVGASVSCQVFTYTSLASKSFVTGAATSVTNSGTGCFSSMA